MGEGRRSRGRQEATDVGIHDCAYRHAQCVSCGSNYLRPETARVMGPEQRREIISRLFTTEAQRKTNSRNAVSCFLVSLCLRGERLLRESSPTFFELYFRRMWASLRNSKLSRAQIKTVSALILFCALAKGRSSGTELVMVVEKNRIVLAADSLVTDDP